MNSTLITLLVVLGFFIIVGANVWWNHQKELQALRDKKELELKKMEKGK